jgi:hypothetical protein
MMLHDGHMGQERDDVVVHDVADMLPRVKPVVVQVVALMRGLERLPLAGSGQRVCNGRRRRGRRRRQQLPNTLQPWPWACSDAITAAEVRQLKCAHFNCAQRGLLA